MPNPISSQRNELNLLGTFASILGVLSIFLYFTGWVYRLAYFDFFQLQVTTLGFPVESFFLIPVQVFFKDFPRSLLTILVFINTVIIIRGIVRWVNLMTSSSTSSSRSWLLKKTRLLLMLFPAQIRQDAIIVTLLLVVLYTCARFQGSYDARQAVMNQTSPLPVVTVLTTKEIGLGRNPQNIFIDSDLDNYRIFGDKALLDSIRGEEINDLARDRVWRLLIQSNGWIYIFESLPNTAKWNQRPRVVAIRESSNSDQLLILSPKPVEKTP